MAFSRRVKLTVAGVLAVPVLGAAVLVAEALVAARGTNLPETDPHALDGLVSPGGVFSPLEPASVADDGADLPVTVDPVRMVFLGDSTAEGVGASSPDTALPRVTAARVAEALDRPVALRSYAVSGARVAGVLADQVGQVPADTDVVVISVGANDTTHLTSKGDFRSRYGEVIGALPSDAAVVLLGVPDMGSTPRLAQPLRFVAGVRGGTIDSVVSDLAATNGFGYVDIAGETGPQFRARPSLFAADRYHPTDAGYVLWADATVPVVLEAIGD